MNMKEKNHHIDKFLRYHEFKMSSLIRMDNVHQRNLSMSLDKK